jgi:hypothetical protein
MIHHIIGVERTSDIKVAVTGEAAELDHSHIARQVLNDVVEEEEPVLVRIDHCSVPVGDVLLAEVMQFLEHASHLFVAYMAGEDPDIVEIRLAILLLDIAQHVVATVMVLVDGLGDDLLLQRVVEVHYRHLHLVCDSA